MFFFIIISYTHILYISLAHINCMGGIWQGWKLQSHFGWVEKKQVPTLSATVMMLQPKLEDQGTQQEALHQNGAVPSP